MKTFDFRLSREMFGGRGRLLPRLSPIKPSLEMEVRLPESPDVEAKRLTSAKRSSACLGRALFLTFHLGDLFGDRSTRLLT